MISVKFLMVSMVIKIDHCYFWSQLYASSYSIDSIEAIFLRATYGKWKCRYWGEDAFGLGSDGGKLLWLFA
jgi:hypothetical protein